MLWQALESTVFFFIRTAPIVIISIYVISYLSRRSYLVRIVSILKPLLERLNMNPISFTVFTLSFFNTVVAYSILSQAWREGKIDKRDVIATSLLSSFPSVFSHLYTFFIPFVIPVLGLLGLVYTVLRLLVALVKTLIGYILIKKGGDNLEVEYDGVSVSENVVKVLVIMFVTYFSVEVAYNLGIFKILIDPLKFLPLNPSSLTIAVLAIFNLRSAIVFTAGLVEKGLSYKWALVGLLLGNVISFSVRSAKHSLPLHVSLFGKFGLKIVIVNSIITFFLDLVIILMLLFI